MTFEELHIIPPILRALREAGYEQPTPIQEAAIPPVLQGRDLLGCAQTGTGKTAAFAVPILQLLAGRGIPQGKRPIRALVLTPTRELALQNYENFELYGRNLGLRAAGDVRFTMGISVLSMWIFRIGFSYLLASVFHLGLMGVWFAMFIDWFVRTILFVWRFLSNRWKGRAIR